MWTHDTLFRVNKTWNFRLGRFRCGENGTVVCSLDEYRKLWSAPLALHLSLLRLVRTINIFPFLLLLRLFTPGALVYAVATVQTRHALVVIEFVSIENQQKEKYVCKTNCGSSGPHCLHTRKLRPNNNSKNWNGKYRDRVLCAIENEISIFECFHKMPHSLIPVANRNYYIQCSRRCKLRTIQMYLLNCWYNMRSWQNTE